MAEADGRSGVTSTPPDRGVCGALAAPMAAEPPHRMATPEEEAEDMTAAAAGVACAAWIIGNVANGKLTKHGQTLSGSASIDSALKRSQGHELRSDCFDVHPPGRVYLGGGGWAILPGTHHPCADRPCESRCAARGASRSDQVPECAVPNLWFTHQTTEL